MNIYIYIYIYIFIFFSSLDVSNLNMAEQPDHSEIEDEATKAANVTDWESTESWQLAV